MTKERIVALLLAGLITASALASCTTSGHSDQTGGTEPNQNPPTNQTTTDPNTPVTPPVATWQDVNKYVYTFKNVTLREEANDKSADLGSIPKDQEIHCTKQSTSWYYVEYEDADGNVNEGYISKASVIEIGSKFEPINESGSKIMYTNEDTINIRPYPTAGEGETFKALEQYEELNTEVTVVASNGTWYRISYKDGFAYIKGNYLSDKEVIDPNDASVYQDLFTSVNGEEGITKYISVGKGGKVNFRVAPNTDKDTTIIMSLSDGCPVIVLKTGTVNGIAWSYVAVLVTSDKEGVPDDYDYGYVSSDYLSDTTGEMTLEQLLSYYSPTFSTEGYEGGKTMYILKEQKINIRNTPVFPAAGEASNVLTDLESGKAPEEIKAITVLAAGSNEDGRWFLVEYVQKNGENETTIRGFVGGKALNYLTTDKTGKPTITIQDLKDKYPTYTILDTPIKVTANSNAVCFSAPATDSETLGTIAAGTEVTLIAEQPGGTLARWYVVQDAEGNLFFVGKQFFN